MKLDEIRLLNPPEGVGTEIALKFRWISPGSCKRCKARAEKWNKWGPDKCEENHDEMIGELRDEANRRNLLMSAMARPTILGLVISKAIKTVRKRGPDWKRDQPLRVLDPTKKKTVVNVKRLQPTIKPDGVDDVELVTTHFNPSRYDRQRETFYEWLPTLGVDIAPRVKCYEVVLDDDPQDIDGSIVIRGTRDRHLLWQKEACLNIALERCTRPWFAWLDHDLCFRNPYWLKLAMDQMRSGLVACQLFSRYVFLQLNGTIEYTRPSGTQDLLHGRGGGEGSPGGAWIASTDFLKSIGGFDVGNMGKRQARIAVRHPFVFRQPARRFTGAV